MIRALVCIALASLLGCRQPPDAAPVAPPSSAPVTAAPSSAEPSSAEPSSAEPSSAEPSSAEPSSTLPSSTSSMGEASAGPAAASPPPKSCSEQVAAFRTALAATQRGDSVEPDADASPSIREIHAEIEAAPDASSRAVSIAEGMSEAIRGCAPLVDAFADAAVLGVDDKEAALRASLPRALERCECQGVDVAALSFFVRYAMAAP